MPSIQTFFDCPVPEKLWHYTSMAGFEGIIASGAIWATEVHSTKDSTEFTHAKDVAFNYVNSLEPKDRAETIAKQEALALVEAEYTDGALSEKASQVFVLSVSAAEDLKSQWIEFADGAKGISLALDLSNIRPPSHLNVAVTMAPCLYSVKDKESLIASALDTFMSTTSDLLRWSKDKRRMEQEMRKWQYLDSIYGISSSVSKFQSGIMVSVTQQLKASVQRTAYDLLRCASHCKNSQFVQEEERA